MIVKYYFPNKDFDLIYALIKLNHDQITLFVELDGLPLNQRRDMWFM